MNPTLQGQVTTLIHEFGHILDYELTKDEHAAYDRALARIEALRQSPDDDFAEHVIPALDRFFGSI